MGDSLSRNEDFLILLVEIAKQSSLLTGIARLFARALDFLATTTLASGRRKGNRVSKCNDRSFLIFLVLKPLVWLVNGLFVKINVRISNPPTAPSLLDATSSAAVTCSQSRRARLWHGYCSSGCSRSQH